MRRRTFIAALGGAAAFPLAVRAQQAMPVIGFLHSGSAAPYAPLVNAFRQGLGEAGYVEQRNLAIEFRWAENQLDRLPELAADLVRRKVSVVVAAPAASAVVAKSASADIPVVFGVGNDPVRTGLVASLNRPGGNVTGVHFFTAELAAKRLGMLLELVPATRHVAVLINPTVTESRLSPSSEISRKEAETAAAALGLTADVIYARNNREIDDAFTTIAQKRVNALLVGSSPLFTSRRVQLVTLSMRDRLPVIFPSREFAEVGGLMTYGTSLADAFRKMGIYTGRILKGAKPADLPVEQSTQFEFVVNLQTARSLGLEVPAALLARADAVIE